MEEKSGMWEPHIKGLWDEEERLREGRMRGVWWRCSHGSRGDIYRRLCLYMFIYSSICVWIYTHLFMCVCTYVCACMCAYVCVCNWAVWQVEGCECSLSQPSPDYSAPFIKVSPPWQPLINILPQTPTRTWQRTTFTHTHAYTHHPHHHHHTTPPYTHIHTCCHPQHPYAAPNTARTATHPRAHLLIAAFPINSASVLFNVNMSERI